MNTEALHSAFLKGLSKVLKDELASRDNPDTLDELIVLAIRIDNRLRDLVVRGRRGSELFPVFRVPLRESIFPYAVSACPVVLLHILQKSRCNWDPQDFPLWREGAGLTSNVVFTVYSLDISMPPVPS